MSGWTGMRGERRHNAALAAVLAVVLAAMTWATRGRFWSWTNLQSMGFQLPELGLLSLAMMLPMLSGGINLAVVASANLTGIVMALVLVRLEPWLAAAVPGLAPAAAVLAGAGVSVLIGLGTAAVITAFGVSPILATLGTMTLLKGIGLVITRGAAIGGLDGLQFAGNGSVAGIPVPLLLFGPAAACVSVTLRRRPLGLKLAILGSSPRVAAFAGVDVARSIAKVYVASSLLAGLAALIMISRFNSAKVDYGEAYLLMTILAAVLGGTAADGGFGWVSGLVLALAILQGVSSGFNLLGVSPFVTVAAFGAIILLVTWMRHAGAGRGAGPRGGERARDRGALT